MSRGNKAKFLNLCGQLWDLIAEERATVSVEPPKINATISELDLRRAHESMVASLARRRRG